MLHLSLLFVIASSVAGASFDSGIITDLSQFDSIDDVYIEKLNSAQDSWTAGHNFPAGTKFADLKILSGTIRKELPSVKHVEVPDNIPKSFDSRQHWPHCKSIQEIKNQGHCGSCWAVSSATTMSDRLCISSNGKFNTDISAQYIVSCSDGGGCHGGWPTDAWDNFINNGAPTGGDFHSNQGCQPYLVEPCINRTGSNGHPKQCPRSDYVNTPPCKKTCYNTKYHVTFAKDLHFGKSVHSVANNVQQIEAEIMKNGPVVGVITVYCDFFAYRKGVYQHKTSEGCGLHAIRIIGWGVEDGKDYWLVTNQWGAEWGDHGIVKILKGSDECGIEDSVVAGVTGKI